MKNSLIILILFLLYGCGSKHYFEPNTAEISDKISYHASLPSPVASITRDGATLANGQFITKHSEIPQITLPKEARYLNESQNYFLATNNKNELILIDKQSLITRTINFEANPISASMQDNLIALIFDTNTLGIYDTNANDFIFRQENTQASTNNTLIASPYFLNDLVLLPSLDGKLVIVDKNTKQIIRSIVVNGDPYFNNVFFLDAIQNRLVAATPKRIISVSPSVINTFDANLKDVLFFADRIYLFTSEGEIILTDRDLNEIKRTKLPFAHFSAANHGRFITILETRGYLIALDEELNSKQIHPLPDKITTPVFSATNKIFIHDKILNIN